MRLMPLLLHSPLFVQFVRLGAERDQTLGGIFKESQAFFIDKSQLQLRRQTFCHHCAAVLSLHNTMDPVTQSAHISSSQGFADGQNSAAKESKLSGKT